jgi:hypothetical protein
MSSWRTASSSQRAESVRQYPAEPRWCEWCGNYLGVVRGCHIREGKGRFCNRSHAAKWRAAHNDEKRLEAVRAANAARAKYPAEPRSCLRCGKDLGRVRGSRIHAGRGRFCSHSCVMRWYWENEPQGLRRPRLGRVATCACGRKTRYLWPSRAGQRYCTRCRSQRREVLAHLAFMREEDRNALRQIRREEDLYDRHDAAARLGRSPGHITRYVVDGVLTPVVREIRGVAYLLFRRDDVERLARRLRRARKRPKRIRDLRPKRRGPKPREGPSVIERKRYALILKAADELADQYERERLAGHEDAPLGPPREWHSLRAAAHLAAEQTPPLIPLDYIVDGELGSDFAEAATSLMYKAKRAGEAEIPCKSH